MVIVPHRRKHFGGSVVSTNDLISFWKLDEASGTRSDSFGSNDLTDNNTVGQGTGNVYANCADLETSNSEYFSDADDVSHSSGSFTFSCWVKLESFVNVQGLGSKWSASNQEWGLVQYNDSGTERFALIVDNDGTSLDDIVKTTSSPSTGTWYHVCARHDTDANTIAVFLDGVKDSKSYSSGLYSGSSDFRIGGGHPGIANFDGLIEAAGWWNRALFDAEITALANPNDPFYDQFQP